MKKYREIIAHYRDYRSRFTAMWYLLHGRSVVYRVMVDHGVIKIPSPAFLGTICTLGSGPDSASFIFISPEEFISRLKENNVDWWGK
jgi:hypothetical protein